MTIDLDHLKKWIGRTEDATDVVTAAPLACLAATLDRDDPEPVAGDPVPPGPGKTAPTAAPISCP